MTHTIEQDNKARYHYLERLDSGYSVAQVWLAVDQRLDSTVIIKKFGLNSDLRTGAQHYGAERDALSRGIAYVPRLRDNFQESDGILVLVRDNIPGDSLRRIVEQTGPLPVARACALCRAAAAIAHAFHSSEPQALGLSDLQASNFIAEGEGTLWFVGGGSTAAIFGDRAGRPTASLSPFAYLAPEQLLGSTVRTDIWGLGGLLFYLLTGLQPPADGAHSALAQLYEKVGEVPEEVTYFIRTAMAMRPEDRFVTAQAAGDALRTLSLAKPRKTQAETPALPALMFHRITLSESPIVHALRRGDQGSLPWAKLSSQSAQLRGAIHSDELTGLSTLDIEPYAHQLDTAHRVLTSATMSGGAILADEVGLGKTIESLLILQELRVRELAETALVVAQPQGVITWSEEIRERIRSSAYERGFRIYEGPNDAGYPLLIVSAATLRQSKHRNALAAHRYDIVIADEAHTLSGADGRPNALGRAIASLSRRRVLLLTATPVRRRLRELYTLVSLIRPGFLGTMDEFVDRFEAATDEGDAERRALRALVDGIMVRHRRRDLIELAFPSRSYRTLAYTAARASNVTSGKRDAIVEYVSGIPDSQRLLLFAADPTERAALASLLKKSLPNRNVAVFTGDRAERRRISRAFHDIPGSLLVAGDSGSEGMNWQTADIVVHCDIPWSPSIWEQRVGRVYRLGQHALMVEIVHLVMPGGRDEAVLALYEHAMGLFELAIGEVASLLDYVPDPADRDVQVCIDKAFKHEGVRVGYRGGNRAYDALARYRDVITDARKAYLAACRQSDALDAIFGLDL